MYSKTSESRVETTFATLGTSSLGFTIAVFPADKQAVKGSIAREKG